MKITIENLKALSNVNSLVSLIENAKTNKFLNDVLIEYKSKVDKRKDIHYINQKSQSIVKDNCYCVVNTKFSSNDTYIDEIAFDKSEVAKLQKINFNYDTFKQMFINVSKFILCNYSTKDNVCKHERFYSQCLAEINVILKKRFTENIVHSRSKNIIVKQITHDNIEKLHNVFMNELNKKSEIAKTKTSKLVKAKNKKQVEKKSKKVKVAKS